MKLAIGVNFIKLFLSNLHPQLHILSQNFRQYANIGIRCGKKSFMKLATGANVMST
jgi:hypothetical protein